MLGRTSTPGVPGWKGHPATKPPPSAGLSSKPETPAPTEPASDPLVMATPAAAVWSRLELFLVKHVDEEDARGRALSTRIRSKMTSASWRFQLRQAFCQGGEWGGSGSGSGTEKGRDEGKGGRGGVGALVIFKTCMIEPSWRTVHW